MGITNVYEKTEAQMTTKEKLERDKGLVLHLDFSTPYSVDNLILDKSGNNNHATVVPSTAPVWIENGMIGKGAYQLDGSNYIESDPFENTIDKFTISFWTKGNPLRYSHMVHKGISGANIGGSSIWIGVDGNYKITFSLNGMYTVGNTTTTQDPDVWYHLVMTWDKTNVRGYINGSLEKVYPVSTITNDIVGSSLMLGRSTIEVPSRSYTGIIQDFRIYSTALSAKDVKELYQTRATLDEGGNLSVMGVNYGGNAVEIATNGVLNAKDFSEVGITDGLVAWYPLNGNARDYTMNRNDGTVNGASVAEGLGQSCYSFDGVDDLIESSNSEALNQTESFSLSVWIKPFSFPSFSTVLAKGRSSTWFLTNYVLGLSKNKIRFKGTFSNNIELDSQIVLIENSWYNIVCTYDNDLKASRIFINSIKDNNESLNGKTPTSVNEPLFIGVQGKLYSPFKGLIQDVRIYNRALDPKEIKILYDLTKNTKTSFTEDGKVFIPGQLKEVY